MCRRVLLALPVVLLSFVAVASAAPGATIPAIQRVAKTVANNDVFDAGGKDPLVIRSADDAAAFFDEKNLATLKQSVDFENQIVLVFAWRGSGQDVLSFEVGESNPEHIFFSLKPGRTRDLRPHVHVFALRSNVKWTVK